MRRLLLLRHAKSEHLFGVDDHDRSLAKRGQNDMPIIGKWVSQNVKPVDKIICSTSQRTRETLDLFLEYAQWESEIEYSYDLYLPYFHSLITSMSELDDSIESVMIVGHNPSFTDMFNTLSSKWIDNVPTSGFAEFEIEGEWKDLEKNKHRNTALCFPKMLKNAR
jgi:phosphohistidine phosphatase